MTDFRLTPRAKRHLIDIWDYSVGRWGERRAERYLRAIDDTIALVVAKERRPRLCGQYGPGMSYIRAGSHNIYLRYDAVADLYWVIGVLHQRMDQARHLPTPEGN